jgi:hypothetical protein
MADDPRLPGLQPPPASFATTRDALHRAAFVVVAPRRHDQQRPLGLRVVPAAAVAVLRRGLVHLTVDEAAGADVT